MTRPLVTVGAGGFGREALDVLDAMNAGGGEAAYDHLGVVDDLPSGINLERLAARGVQYLGTISEWLERGEAAEFVVCVGTPAVRSKLVARLAHAGLRAATLIHPDARIGSQVVIGDGSVVCGGVQVSTNVRLGSHVHLNPNATIGHDSVLGDFVSVNPGAIISGDVEVEPGALVGAGAVVLQQLRVGAGGTVGAAACVVRDVPADTIVKGIPAS